MAKGLGRKSRNQWKDIEKYPYRNILTTTTEQVEDSLPLPYWHWTHDQGSEGACVGFGTSMMMSILNEIQARAATKRPYSHRYDTWWLWREARLADGWDGNDDLSIDEGTWVNAAAYTLWLKGHRRIKRGDSLPEDKAEGVSWYRWAQTVDEMRTAIAQGLPMSIGVTWYSNFDTPVKKGYREWWIGQNYLGSVRGGHCLTVYGASDRRQAFKLKNSWGRDYPLVWIPYETMQQLIDDYGEVVLVTDR